MKFSIYDSGKSMLSTYDNVIPIPTIFTNDNDLSQMFLLAEFGLAVAPTAKSNYVNLSGTISLVVEDSTQPDIKIVLTQRNTSGGDEEIIYISGGSFDAVGILPFDMIIDNSEDMLPQGYYAYRLYIVNLVDVDPSSQAFVSGPFIFKGLSYKEDTESANNDTIFNLDVVGTGNVVNFNMESIDTNTSSEGNSDGTGDSGSTAINIKVNGDYNTVTFSLKEQIGPIV